MGSWNLPGLLNITYMIATRGMQIISKSISPCMHYGAFRTIQCAVCPTLAPPHRAKAPSADSIVISDTISMIRSSLRHQLYGISRYPLTESCEHRASMAESAGPVPSRQAYTLMCDFRNLQHEVSNALRYSTPCLSTCQWGSAWWRC